MRIALLGATGETGLAVARTASERGHEVTALARRSNATLDSLDNVRVVYGDARDAATIARLLDGQDAVISSLGLTAEGSSTEKVYVCTDAVQHILDEFERTAPRRLVVVSTHGVNDSHDDSPYVKYLWDHAGERLVDKERMEQLLFPSDNIDWTIVRCPRIDDGRGSGTLRHGALRLEPAEGVPRELLAEFLIDLLDADQFTRTRFSVAG